VPIFPELRPYLEQAWTDAKPKEEFVISRRRKNVTLRTQFERILKNAGLTPWPKLFQNLRSTRQTELINQGYSLHVVCAWLGNKAAVALEHYAQVRDEDYERASKSRTSSVVHNLVHASTPMGTNAQQASPLKAGLLLDSVVPSAVKWATQDSNL